VLAFALGALLGLSPSALSVAASHPTAAGATVAFTAPLPPGADATALLDLLLQPGVAWSLDAWLSAAALPELAGASVASLAPAALALASAPAPPPAGSLAIGAVSVSSATATQPALVDPGAAVTLAAVVSSLGAPTLLWSQALGAPLNLTGLARGYAALTLPPGSLSPGGRYAFRLDAADASGAATAYVTLQAMELPAGGTIAVSPATGAALSTPFTLTTAGWTDGNVNAAGQSMQLPLAYAFWYTLARADGTAGLPVLLSGQSGPSVAGVLLPQGKVTLYAAARNSLGGAALLPAAEALQVEPLTFASGDQQSAFLANLTQSNANASGTQAAAVAAAAAAMLNAPGALNATAAAAARADLLAFVSSSIVDTAEGLQAAAGAVASLLANASEVSPSGAAFALAALSSISVSGALSSAAASSVGQGLSQLCASSLASGPGTGGVLTAAASVVDSLAAGLAALSVPGAPPTVISTAHIALSVESDVPSPGSRLFTSPLSIPGAASSFSLPSSLFSGAVSAGAPIASAFRALTFDPFVQTGCACPHQRLLVSL